MYRSESDGQEFAASIRVGGEESASEEWTEKGVERGRGCERSIILLHRRVLLVSSHVRSGRRRRSDRFDERRVALSTLGVTDLPAQ
jgi:hypothetical protein